MCGIYKKKKKNMSSFQGKDETGSCVVGHLRYKIQQHQLYKIVLLSYRVQLLVTTLAVYTLTVFC